MYLESLTIKNYRKFRSADNTVCFVRPEIIDINKGTGKIAPSTTLIIGKNNAGKTTVVKALEMLCNNNQPSGTDFNLSYLNHLFKQYKTDFKNDENTNFEYLETPNLEFTLSIKIDFNEDDLITYLAPFISISEEVDGQPISVRIVVKVVLVEEIIFKKGVRKIFQDTDLNHKEQVEKFYELLSKKTSIGQPKSNLYKTGFIDILGDAAYKFSLKNLINIKEIKANRDLKEGVLSDVFNKIVSFQFTNDPDSRKDFESRIKSINKDIDSNLEGKNNGVSEVLRQVESTEKVDLSLSGNVTYDGMMKGLIKYNFMDDGDYIPEDQFGLGYISLLNIIGEIIHFVDSYEDNSHSNRINLLFIEEPEAFMHPQMQELFIKRIDNAVNKALEVANESSKSVKKLQCQIAITTHSSHIVNSKIHSSNTFNNLNYLTSINKCTKAVNLTDEGVISSSGNDANKELSFIKKHIKYKVSELFFSDAVIFVEGITEETLLNYYLENHPSLSNYYISVFNINGAHGKLYLPLVKKLSVPSLIVTDLDIKREKCEKNETHKESESCQTCGQKAKDGNKPFVEGSAETYVQITNLDGRTTTNSTIKKFNNESGTKLDGIDFFEVGNLYVVFQNNSIEGQYATSLEEALILTNHDNDIVNAAIKKCKPDIYEDILKEDSNLVEPRKNLISHSYKLQKKLSGSKSMFSNELLFKLLSAEEDADIPILPDYLEEGLNWLVNKLTANDSSLSNKTEEHINNTAEESMEAVSNDA